MLFAIRLPRTEVTLVCYRRKCCRLSVKRRRCSRSSASCANKDARLWPASVPVRRGLECVEHAEGNGLYWCFRSGVCPLLSGAAWSVYNTRSVLGGLWFGSGVHPFLSSAAFSVWNMRREIIYANAKKRLG